MRGWKRRGAGKGVEGAMRIVVEGQWSKDSHGDWDGAVAPGISGIVPVVTLEPHVTLGNGDGLVRPSDEN